MCGSTNIPPALPPCHALTLLNHARCNALLPAGSRHPGCWAGMCGGTRRSLSAPTTVSQSGWMLRTHSSCCIPAAVQDSQRECCTQQVGLAPKGGKRNWLEVSDSVRGCKRVLGVSKATHVFNTLVAAQDSPRAYCTQQVGRGLLHAAERTEGVQGVDMDGTARGTALLWMCGNHRSWLASLHCSL